MAQLYANNAYGSLAASASNSTTTLTLASGTGARFPSPTGGDYFLATLTGLDSNSNESSWEIVKVTARATDTLTVVRAQESTTAAAWPAGTRIEQRATAGGFGSYLTGNQSIAVSGDASGSGTTAISLTLATVSADKGGTGQTSYAVGDLLYASTTTALSKLADVATGNALLSGGVGAAPAWGKVALATHVSGTLPVANGGTGLTSYTANGVVYASGASTLASGSALTFDGTTLATAGKFGITGSGATPTASALQIGTNGVGSRWLYNVPTGGEHNFTENSTVLSWQNISSLGWLIAGSEQMRLTSTGLGIGTTSPGAKLDISSASSRVIDINSTSVNGTGIRFNNSGTINGYIGSAKYTVSGGALSDFSIDAAGANSLVFGTNDTERMRLDASGNLGLGVTPSAWADDTAMQIKWGSVSSGYEYGLSVNQNAYRTASNVWRYQVSSFNAARYNQTAGQHQWYTAPSGTADAAISFTQAMTLDASGNLGVGTTSPVGRLTIQGATGTSGINQGIGLLYSNGTQYGALGLNNSTGWPQLMARAGAGLTFHVNSDLVTTGEVMRLDASGNLGLGVTPSAWGSNWRAMQVGASGALWSSNAGVAATYVANNYYFNGTSRIYTSTGAAAEYYQGAGEHRFYTAPSGTAGAAISFTQAMTLDASGRLLIGQTAEKTQEVLRISSAGQASLLLDNTGKTNGAFAGVFNDAAIFSVNRNPSTGTYYNASNYAAEVIAVGSSSTSYLAFTTANAANTVPTERARIDASGNLVLKTGSLQEVRTALAANEINLNLGNYFTKTISGATTLTVSNVPATGTAASFILDLTNGGSATITWWTVKWAGGTAPTLTAAGRDVLGFFTHDGGTTWSGLVLGKDLK